MNNIFVLTILALIGLTFAQVCDDENAEFKTCGTACPLSCSHPFQNMMCIDVCRQGCFCKSGYLKEETSGKCVLREKCPQISAQISEECTGENEVFTNCGSACPVTCANMNETGRACIDLCVRGCFCKAPYVRGNGGKCVLKERCLPSVSTGAEFCADPHEVYETCGTACPLTCKNFANPPEMCIMMCKVGCACVAPYVRDEITGKCVLTTECPTVSD